MNLSEIPVIVKKEKILFGKNIELNESLEVISIFYKSDENIVQSKKCKEVLCTSLIVEPLTLSKIVQSKKCLALL